MADRDSKGRLLPGHPRLNNEPGHCGGAPKTIKGQIRDALAEAEADMPEIYAVMRQRAKGEIPDCPQAVQQAAAEYLSDRIYGKPNLPLTGAGGKDLFINYVIGKGYLAEV